MNPVAPIYHLALAADVAAMGHRSPENDAGAGEPYRAVSLADEGFLHCCDADQLAGVVSRYYAEVDDVLLLTIDPAALDAPPVRENTVGGDELFPHVYGPIPAAAILATLNFGLASEARRACLAAGADGVAEPRDGRGS